MATCIVMAVVLFTALTLMVCALVVQANDDDIPHLLVCFEGDAYFRGFQTVAATAIAANMNPYMWGRALRHLDLQARCAVPRLAAIADNHSRASSHHSPH